MAKTARVKKRQVTLHSRAARRAASPSIDVDKKLKQTTRAATSPSRPAQAQPHALAAQNAGVQKRQKKGTMTRAQRLRHQKGLERAADVLDKRHVKVVKSLGKERIIKERSKGWEDVNGEGKKKRAKTSGLDHVSDDDDNDDDDDEQKKDRGWVSDEDMDDSATTAPAEISLPVAEDELL
ncbi:hypothetical protein ACEQ8H_006565 [Pleosporales sp. CAS-2024a]